MKKLSEWALELPKEFRTQMTTVLDQKHGSENFDTIKKALSYFLSLCEEEGMMILLKELDWDGLLRKYAANEAKIHHVVYWFAEDDSRGCTVEALNPFHAIDIVQARQGVDLDQIIYVHAKESVYRPKIDVNKFD